MPYKTKEERVKHDRAYYASHRQQILKQKREKWWNEHDEYMKNRDVQHMKEAYVNGDAFLRSRDFPRFCRDCGVGLVKGLNWRTTEQRYLCRTCENGRYKHWYLLHKERKRQLRAVGAAHLKEESIRAYSPEMNCQNSNCEVPGGARNIHALTIDHIEGKGNEHRRQIGNGNLYRWLKRHGYPKGFQVLCGSCQYIKKYEKREFGKGRPEIVPIKEEIIQTPDIMVDISEWTGLPVKGKNV